MIITMAASLQTRVQEEYFPRVKFRPDYGSEGGEFESRQVHETSRGSDAQTSEARLARHFQSEGVSQLLPLSLLQHGQTEGTLI